MRQNPRQRKRDGKRVARLERLIEVSRALNSTLSLRPLLHDIVVAAQELTDTEACSIMLVDRTSGQLYFEEATNLTGIRSIVVPMEGSVAGWVVKTGEPVVIADARSDPRFYRKVDDLSARGQGSQLRKLFDRFRKVVSKHKRARRA